MLVLSLVPCVTEKKRKNVKVSQYHLKKIVFVVKNVTVLPIKLFNCEMTDDSMMTENLKVELTIKK